MKTNKFKTLSIIIILILTISTPSIANAQNKGPRPPYREHHDKRNRNDFNSLPRPAKDFIKKHFYNAKIDEIDFKPHYRVYEVELRDGTDIDFDNRGNCIKIDSDNKSIPAGAVKAMLPNKAYNILKKKKNHDDVESIEVNNRGYKVELRKGRYDELYFDRQGNLVRQTD